MVSEVVEGGDEVIEELVVRLFRIVCYRFREIFGFFLRDDGKVLKISRGVIWFDLCFIGLYKFLCLEKILSGREGKRD